MIRILVSGFQKLLLSDCSGGRVVVLYPHSFMDWDDASAFLSRALKSAVFSFHIHDGDLWMDQLFVGGSAVDQFNPLPDYWGDVCDDDRQHWAGDPAVLAAHWPGLSAADVENYLVPWEPQGADEGGKAYPDDEFARGTDWQLTDFMRRLGLQHPINENGAAHGTVFTLTRNA